MISALIFFALYFFIGIGTGLARQDQHPDAFKTPGSLGMWVALWLPMIAWQGLNRSYKLLTKGQ